MGSNFVDFTFEFDTTLIQLNMAQICSTEVFAPSPWNRQLRTPPGIGVRIKSKKSRLNQAKTVS